MRKDTALYFGDDQKQKSLGRYLELSGIELHKTSAILEAKEMLEKQHYDLVLIQYETLRKDIFDFYSFIRRENPSSIIIVLMKKMMPKIETELFDHGVDDVASDKQINPSVLAARIKRRYYNGKLLWPAVKKLMLKGGTVINFARMQVRLNGSRYKLSKTCDKLIRYFLRNPDRVISTDELWESEIWQESVARENAEEEGKAIKMAIVRLRQLIEIDPRNPQIIETVHKQGWILARDAVL